MAKLIRPGRLVRATLSVLGVLFLPLGVWFIRDPKHRYLTESIALIVVALVCFYYGFRRDTKLMELLDEL